jgi:hypothetical protein
LHLKNNLPLKMNTRKKYLKVLSAIAIIACLVFSAKLSYRLTRPNASFEQQQAGNFNKTPSYTAAPNKAANFSPLKSTIKTTKKRIPSDREKYEAFLNTHPFHNRSQEVNEKEIETDQGEAREEQENKPDRPDLAFQQDFIRTMNPGLKRPTPELLTEMIKKNQPFSGNAGVKTNRMPGDQSSAATNWIERGPDNVGGRTRALTWDPTTANKVWAGGVTGGLWYNTNITDANSSWVRVDDFWSTLSITKIVFDPKNAQTAYVSTGEGFSVGKAIGGGVWKTTDGGTSWSQLTSTQNMCYINDIAVRTEMIGSTPTGVIYAAADAGYYEGNWFYVNDPRSMIGLYRSENGGATWTQVLPRVPSTGPPTVAAAISISASNRIWIGTKSSPYSNADRGGGRVMYSDDGLVWNVSNTLTDASNGRVTVACAPSDSNYVYSFMENRKGDNSTGSGGAVIVRKSTDNGATWLEIAQPDDADNEIAADDFTRGQAFYNQSLMVDPNDPKTVVIGGINLFRSTSGGSRPPGGGPSWIQISKWSNNAGLNTLNCSIVHADQHAISFKPGSSTTAVFGTDGGIYFTSNLASAGSSDAIAARNKNFNVTQFYSVAVHPNTGNNNHLAGAQDNGTQRFSVEGVNSTVDVSGGDGAYCFIDQLEPNFQINSYVYNNYYLSTTGGIANSFNNQILTENAASATSSFINPACYDNNQHALYTFKNSDGTTGGAINIVKNITTTPVASSIAVANLSADASALKVSPYTTSSTTLYIGTISGKLIRLTDAGGTPVETNISGNLPVGAISCIEIGRNESELLVTFFNYGINKIWYSTDSGATWVNKMGDFKNIPVRWALFNPNHPTTEVILATELGIYGTANFDNAAPTWTAKNTGFANVRTDMLQMRNSDYLVIAATHGRGLFSSLGFSEAAAPTINSFTPVNGSAGTTVTITGTNFTGATAVSFGGAAAASFTVINASSITAVMGANASSSSILSVTTPGGIATKAGFSIIQNCSIASFSPANAGNGKMVTITGTNFTGATAVSFGDTNAASFTVVNNTTINAVVGMGASGSVSVSNPVSTATKTGFVFIPIPTITASGATTICILDSVTLTSSAASGNQWLLNSVAIPGANKTTYIAASAGSYSVIASVGDGTSAESVASVVTLSAISNTTLTSSAGSIAQTKCINTAITNITYTANGATGANFSGLPAGVTGTWTSNIATISGTPNVIGTFNYSIRFTGGCHAASTGSMVVLDFPNAPIITSSASSFCADSNATLTSNTVSGNNWYKDGIAIAGANSVSYLAKTAGVYTDTIVNAGGCKAGSLPTTLTTIASPAKPTISWNGAEFSTAAATSFQWFLNTVSINGANNISYKPTAIGLYKVEVSNANGCKNESDNFNLVVTALNNPATTSVSNLATIFPNPASPVLLVKFRETPTTTLEIRLLTNEGRTVQLVKTKDKLTSIPINNLPSGNYFIRITGNNYNQTEGVIISK